MDSPSQKQIWNEIAPKWNRFREKPLAEVTKFLNQYTGNLLDLGCGSGRHFVKSDKIKIYGTDFSEEMLALAKRTAEKKLLNIELKQMQNEEIPYPENFFDSVICIAVLHCIETAEKRKKLIYEIRRVLKPKGKALIQVWSANHRRLKNKEKEVSIPWKIDSQKKVKRYYYIYSKEELKQDLEKSGLKVLEEHEDKNITLTIEKS
jgi:ubiquinone/menaquinone biosynthesis C-methylase UbiE